MKPFNRLILIGLGAGLLAAVSGSFISALPAPLNRLHVSLLLCCALIGTFRPAEALAAALGAGFFWESLTAAPHGAHLLTLPLVVFLCDQVFRRLLSNLSWPAFAFLNGLAYVLFHSLLAVIELLANRLAGWQPVGTVSQWAGSLLFGCLAQVVLALLGLWLFRSLGNRLKSRYLYSHHVRP